MPSSEGEGLAYGTAAGPGDLFELLRVKGLQKSFPGVQAVRDASFDLRAGQIHALVGENGAGKSTLIKVLTGAHQPDGGRIEVQGAAVRFGSPSDSLRAGIVAIYQEFSLVPSLSVAANLFLGREQAPRGVLRIRHELETAREVLARLATPLDPKRLVSSLTVAEQQQVEIARALVADARILIMDEPTAALTPREVDRLFGILRELVQRGMGIVFVSHRLDEVLGISDQVTVMRDGVTVASRPVSQVSRRELIELMVGRTMDDEFPKGKAERGGVRLSVRGLSGGKVRDVSFSVCSGEILGLAGLMGAGRTELARLIFGADERESGSVWIDDVRVDPDSPSKAAQGGICLLTEDRKREGLVPCASAVENFALPSLARWSKLGLLALRREAEAFHVHVKALGIKMTSAHQRAETLSGGNQQKLLIARWLETDSAVFMFDEPTRGIDVGAKYEIYAIIRKLAAAGKAVILISSELPEILGMCDRVLVMKAGRLAGEIETVAGTTPDEIMALAV
jgi:ABC-type sugar transport system ATPase subunit